MSLGVFVCSLGVSRRLSAFVNVCMVISGSFWTSLSVSLGVSGCFSAHVYIYVRLWASLRISLGVSLGVFAKHIKTRAHSEHPDGDSSTGVRLRFQALDRDSFTGLHFQGLGRVSSTGVQKSSHKTRKNTCLGSVW